MGASRVSAAEANRNFSALLRRVQQGERITITSRARPVAEIAPPRPSLETADERDAVVVAAAAEAGCAFLMVEDAAVRWIGAHRGVRMLDPFAEGLPPELTARLG